MDPRSEVLLRQPELFTGNVLLAGLPADDLLRQLPAAHGWSWHAGDEAALNARFPERCHFGVEPGALPFDAAVVFLPKSRELTDYLLHALASRLAGRELRDRSAIDIDQRPGRRGILEEQFEPYRGVSKRAHEPKHITSLASGP